MYSTHFLVTPVSIEYSDIERDGLAEPLLDVSCENELFNSQMFILVKQHVAM